MESATLDGITLFCHYLSHRSDPGGNRLGWELSLIWTELPLQVFAMAKPILFTVDDDPDVLQTIARDLRQHYGEHYRVIRADSGAAALDALARIVLRQDPVALLLVD